MSKLIVFVTAPDKKVAKIIAKELLDKNLAACISIQEPVVSLFHWKGKVEEENEVLLMIKTNTKAFKALESAIRKIHPYDVPEIIASSITHGNSDYLKWIDDTITKDL